jgi:hypothetical protein
LSTGRISLGRGALFSSDGRRETISAQGLSADVEVSRCFAVSGHNFPVSGFRIALLGAIPGTVYSN